MPQWKTLVAAEEVRTVQCVQEVSSQCRHTYTHMHINTVALIEYIHVPVAVWSCLCHQLGKGWGWAGGGCEQGLAGVGS